jgi:hypothetical protein
MDKPDGQSIKDFREVCALLDFAVGTRLPDLLGDRELDNVEARKTVVTCIGCSRSEQTCGLSGAPAPGGRPNAKPGGGRAAQAGDNDALESSLPIRRRLSG